MPPVSAAVIAGGASSRMGRPKGLLEIDGAPLITRVTDVLSRLSDDLICVTCRPQEYAFAAARLRMVPDFGGVPQGPLSGILAALEASRNDLCVVVAVDMPFLNAELLRYLARLATGYDVVLPIVESDRPECLHAVYRKSCLPHGKAALESGLRRVAGFFPDVAVRRVHRFRLRRYDSELTSFENVNTPRELTHVLEKSPIAGSRLPGGSPPAESAAGAIKCHEAW